MNCKEGDLAVFVKSNAGNEGKIVKCVRLASKKELDVAWFSDSEGPVWVLDQVVRTTGMSKHALGIDSYLKPIRDQDGEDEMLNIAGYPKEKVVQ